MKAKIPQKKIEDFYRYDFESWDVPADCYGDYAHVNFFKKYVVPMFRKELKAMAKNIGAELTFSAGHFEVSGFFCRDGRYAYFHIGDVRYNVGGYWYDNVLYRTAKSVADYTGGSNRYCLYKNLEHEVDELLEMGA